MRVRAGHGRAVTTQRRWPAVAASIAFFLLCLLLSLAALAPASLLDAALASNTGGRLRLADAEGTLWHGSGSITATSGQGRTRVEWRVATGALIRGTIPARATIGSAAPARIEAARERLEVGALDMVLPAALVLAALGPYDGYAVGGSVRLSTAGTVLTPSAASGRVDIEWQRASTGLLDGVTLGSYRARIDLDVSGGRAELSTTEGALALSGNGRWTPGGLALSLAARAEGVDAERIRNWLRTMAPVQPDGSFRFAWPPPQRAGARS